MGDAIDSTALIVGIIVTCIFLLLTLATIMYGAGVWWKEWKLSKMVNFHAE